MKLHNILFPGHVTSASTTSPPTILSEEETTEEQDTTTDNWVLIGISTSADKVSTTPLPGVQGSTGSDEMSTASSTEPLISSSSPSSSDTLSSTSKPSTSTQKVPTISSGKPANASNTTTAMQEGSSTTMMPGLDIGVNMSNFKDGKFLFFFCARILFCNCYFKTFILSKKRISRT